MNSFSIYRIGKLFTHVSNFLSSFLFYITTLSHTCTYTNQDEFISFYPFRVNVWCMFHQLVKVCTYTFRNRYSTAVIALCIVPLVWIPFPIWACPKFLLYKPQIPTGVIRPHRIHVNDLSVSFYRATLPTPPSSFSLCKWQEKAMRG